MRRRNPYGLSQSDEHDDEDGRTTYDYVMVFVVTFATTLATFAGFAWFG